MSFSSDTKTQLATIEISKKCCKRSLLAGMLMFSNVFQSDKIKLITENENVAELYKSLLSELYNITTNEYITEKHTNPDDDKKPYKSYKITAVSARQLKPLKELNPPGVPSCYRVNHGIFECENCRKSFIRGAFLASGTVSDPVSSYHLEIYTPYMNLSKDVLSVLEDIKLPARQTIRGSAVVLYYKDSEMIIDFLNTIGANNAAFKMMDRKIFKEYRNKVNRVVNFETANIGKAVAASKEAIQAIEFLESAGILQDLDDELKITAQARVEFPELSLAELSKVINPPVSKSGLSHRLKKLINIAKEKKG